MDNLKTQENLEWDNHNSELIEYVDLDNIDLNYGTLSKETKVSCRALLFLIRIIVNFFRFSLANFSTDGVSGSQMSPLLWNAISIHEKNSLKVIAITCNGASPNSKLYRVQYPLTLDNDIKSEADFTYRTSNSFSGTEKDSFTLFLIFYIC